LYNLLVLITIHLFVNLSITMKSLLIRRSCIGRGAVTCCGSSTIIRGLSSIGSSEDSGYGNKHFRITNTKHPLMPNKVLYSDREYGDHTGRLQNHIWTKQEITDLGSNLYRHIPKTMSDHVMNKIMYGLYYTFNFITNYSHDNPTVKSIEWRLIVLESVAGVPGFIAAAVRHFHSLR